MAKKKVFWLVKYLKFIVEEMCMQMTLDDWLGKGTVSVKLNKPNDDEVEITIFRKYGKFYRRLNRRFSAVETPFLMEEEFISPI